jgi:hypothetical protein
MRLAQRHLVCPLDPLARGKAALFHDRPVDPDEISQFHVLRVVSTHDRGAVIAVSEVYDDLV